MGFGQAFEDASAIITLIMLIPAFLILFVMSQNIGNPEFDMTATFTSGMGSIIQAISPTPVLTIIIAIVLLLIGVESGGR